MDDARTRLADALVDTANHFECVAVLMQAQSWEDPGPWCLTCPDSEDCWAWDAMRMLTCQELAEAKSRHRTRNRRKWARSWGAMPMSLIKVTKDGDHSQAAGTRSLRIG
jgi:hypothetical protein